MQVSKKILNEIKMKKLYILILLFCIFSSCSDAFLDLKPEQSVADTDALRNLEDYNSSITGVYNDL